MIEAKVPKEVREYEEKWLIGMTKRQLFCSFLAAIINVPIYIKLKPIIGDELAGWAILITAAPFVALGFYKYNGIPLEKMLKFIYIFKSTPQIRVYKTDNFYRQLKESYKREETENAIEKKSKTKKWASKEKK